MPQINRQSIGFSDEGIERLRSLTQVLNASQRLIVESLILELTDEEISKIVQKHQAAIKEKLSERKVVVQQIGTKPLTAEQLAAIQEIINAKKP